MSDTAANPSHACQFHTLPRLQYGFDALEPHIDARTVQVHYRKHHLSYVIALNRAVSPYQHLHHESAETLCRNLDKVPVDIRHAVRLAAGGHWNHSRMWEWMTPHGSDGPFGISAGAIAMSFGSVAEFRHQLFAAAAGVCGSGWAWVTAHAGGRLVIATSANQDNPLMTGVTPVLGVDVWEHAYYLKHQNRRADHLAAWWQVVNWGEVNRCLRRTRATGS